MHTQYFFFEWQAILQFFQYYRDFEKSVKFNLN